MYRAPSTEAGHTEQQTDVGSFQSVDSGLKQPWVLIPTLPLGVRPHVGLLTSVNPVSLPV